MAKLKVTLLLIVLPGYFSSCDPCRYLECAPGNIFGQFRIVSASNGNDLVFGPTRIYDASQIRFYSLKGSDTTFLEYQTIRFPGTGYDSILYVLFYPRPGTVFVRLSGDIDTLAISYETKPKSRCCGPTTNITSFRFNNSVDIPNNGTQEIKK